MGSLMKKMNAKTNNASQRRELLDQTIEMFRKFDEFLRLAGAPSPKKTAPRSVVLRAGILRTKGLKFNREEANER